MVTYDKCGRMEYNAELHDRVGEPWTEEEIQYLTEWYDIIGAEEMSLALGRTEMSISNKVNSLRNRGQMKRRNTLRNDIPKLLRCAADKDHIWRVYC